jgi:hypothetical protein
MGVLLAMFAISTTYVLTKLYIARSLVWERQKKGLVRSFPSITIPTQLMTLSRWLEDTRFFIEHLLYLKSMIDKLPPNAHK